MRDADGEFHHLQAALHVAARIGNGLAMLGGEQVRQFVDVAVDQIDEAHHYAGAALRVCGRPGRLSGLGVGDGSVHFGPARERGAGLHLPDIGVENIGEPAGLPRHMLAADEMREVPNHDRSLKAVFC